LLIYQIYNDVIERILFVNTAVLLSRVIVVVMGGYMSTRNTRKRSSSEASLDTEVGNEADIRNRKKYVLIA